MKEQNMQRIFKVRTDEKGVKGMNKPSNNRAICGSLPMGRSIGIL